MAFQVVSRWRSYDFPKLPPSTMELINLILEQLEMRHGYKLTSHILSLITCSKYGLSDSEIDDILSIDDEVVYEMRSCPLFSHAVFVLVR